MTKDMLDHRFKAIRAHVDVVRDAVAQGVDCANIPADLPKGRKGKPFCSRLFVLLSHA